MADIILPDDETDAHQGTLMELDRRRMLRRAGVGMSVAALAATGVLASTSAANATNPNNGGNNGPSDVDIINFALNLEYVEAEFYLYAVTGQGLAPGLRSLPSGGTATGTQGSVSPGAAVPFRSSAIQQYASRIAVDELAHVTFLRAVLGTAAVAEPTIDVGIGPNSAFSKLAVAAGLIVQGQTFNPYQDDISFLLGASIFEDVGVTAYAGAARFIGNPNYLEAAAGILAVEAYHSGAIRTLLANIGAGVAFNAISNLRGTLSAATGGPAAEQGILLNANQSFNFLANDGNALAYRRTTRQVLNIVYGAPGAASGLFFPNGLNGNIAS